MRRIKGIKTNILFSICLGVIFDINAIASMSKKYNPKSFRRVIGVNTIQRIMERNEIISIGFEICFHGIVFGQNKWFRLRSNGIKLNILQNLSLCIVMTLGYKPKPT